MIKAERMKKKMGLGRGELITIETIKVCYNVAATVWTSNKLNALDSWREMIDLKYDEICFYSKLRQQWKVRERAGRDGNGNFVGISCDEESPVAAVNNEESPVAAVESSAEKPVDTEDEAASVGTQEEEETMNWCINMS